jgi:hypothetical protein
MNNEKWNNPKKVLDALYQSYEVITNRFKYENKNRKQEISIDQLKSLYNGFYAGYNWLLTNKLISGDKKIDLIAKKQTLDIFFNQNIKNKENKMLNIHKSVANRIPTSNLSKL